MLTPSNFACVMKVETYIRGNKISDLSVPCLFLCYMHIEFICNTSTAQISMTDTDDSLLLMMQFEKSQHNFQSENETL